MEILGFMQADTMLCANASFSFADLLKDLLIMPDHVLFLRNYVYVNVSIADMPVAEYLFA